MKEYIPDNYDVWNEYDKALNKATGDLPLCNNCGEPIFQETAVCMDGEWFCDDCLNSMRERTEDIPWQ